MDTNKKITHIILIFILFWFFHSNFFTKSMIVGTYVSIGVPVYRSFYGEPIRDSLFLFADGTFTAKIKQDKVTFPMSSKGTYEISKEPLFTEIEFKWHEKHGIPPPPPPGTEIDFDWYEKYNNNNKIDTVSWNTYFTRIWFSRIRIPIDSDVGIYYEKIY